MRLVSIRELRTKTRSIRAWLSAAEDIVLTSNGKPIGILSPVTEETLEVELMAMRQARAVRALNRLQELSHLSGVDRLSDEDINHEISVVRRTHVEPKEWD
jgi:antitoxin (DNA-binding transcriptional repressor) of toxin-antitoxin stability system